MFNRWSIVGNLASPLAEIASKIYMRLGDNPYGLHVYATKNGNVHTYSGDSPGAIGTPDNLRIGYYVNYGNKLNERMIREDSEESKIQLGV